MATEKKKSALDELFAGVRAGDTAILARALTLVESTSAGDQKSAEELLTRLLPHTGGAIRVGVTGPPGVGKSTFIEALGMHLVEHGRRVAVLTIDPSSEISGGSILADKTRMTKLSAHAAAYIRPSPSAGALGGVTASTRQSLLVCEAAGYDVVLIETVGVGQSETMVADTTDCILALMLPGAGDELQGIKRGLLELVDVIAVNKADGETKAAAELAASQYEAALCAMSGRKSPVVLTCSALQSKGVEQVWQAISQRYEIQLANGSLNEQRGKQNLRWLWHFVEQQMRMTLRTHPQVAAIRESLERGVAAGETPAEVAARRILKTLVLTEN